MAGKIWYKIAGRESGEELHTTAKAAKESLDRTLQNHEAKGHKVWFEVEGQGAHPLWIVEHEGEVIAKYRLVD